MSENDQKIIQSLIAGGLIGASLGALIADDTDEGVSVGALAGAVILATFNANEMAQKTNLPVYIVENGKLFEIKSGGIKRYIKDIPKPNIELSKHFKLI